MNILMSVQFVKIHHRFLWEFRVYILELARLADMMREVVQEMDLHKVGI